MAWWMYLLLRLPELVVVLVGLALALVRRHTLGGRTAGLAIGGMVVLALSVLLGWTLTVLVLTNPRAATGVLSPFVLLQIVDILLYVTGLGLVVAAVFAGRAGSPAPARRGAVGAGAQGAVGARGATTDNGQPPVAGGWTPPQQAQPADWRVMSGVWSLPRERFDQPPP